MPITRRGAPSSPAPERMRQTNQFTDLALSPDGRKVAFVARGEVFAASAKDGGDAARVTATPAIESQPVWAPDSRRLAYVAARDGAQQLRLYDFASSTETPLTSGAATDLVAGVLARRAGRSRSSATARSCACWTSRSKQDRVVATGTFADTLDTPRPVWSPDGKWIAVFAIGAKALHERRAGARRAATARRVR